ncbi:E3 SUMO-protein ligase SIZ1-like protein [Drosera capensis]
MDLVSSCKDKLQYFRIKELKDVLTQLGFSKQGKKQDLVDRILAILADDQASKLWAKRSTIGKEEVARLVDDAYRKMQVSGASNLATKPQATSDSSTLKPKEEVDDTYQLEMKMRCLCGSSLLTESMIKCEDPKCLAWQHIGCVIIPEKPMEGTPPVPSQFYCELCRLNRADPFWLAMEHPLYPVKLITTNLPADGSTPVQGVEKTFQLTRAHRDLVAKAEYDVQAWCMLLNDKVPFRMQWPQYADLQVNGVPVRAINRPGLQLLGANGRDDGPIITPCTRDGINKISLTGCDARIFCLGVRIVKRRSLQQDSKVLNFVLENVEVLSCNPWKALSPVTVMPDWVLHFFSLFMQILNMIPKEQDGERFEDALARVRRCVGGGNETENADSDSDIEVVADSFTINLRCPWQCPICLKNYSLEHIIIDPYFNRITTLMRSCGEDTTEIEVKPDGSWRVKGESERKDLRLWRLPDSTLSVPNNTNIKPEPESSKPIKLEGGTGLKIGIRKNSNGRWEVKHDDTNTISSGEKLREKLKSNIQKVIPMSSTATGSGRDGDDHSVNQEGNANFDFAANTGLEFDSMSLNLDVAYGFPNQNVAATVGEANVIVLSDSDDEANNMLSDVFATNAPSDAANVNFPVANHVIPDSFQDPLGTAGPSCMDLFNPTNDDFGTQFGTHLWQLPPSNQAGPNFQLFGSDAGGSDTFVGLHDSSGCPAPMNGYTLSPEIAVNNSAAFVPDSSACHFNNDLNDGLVDNPLAFGGHDPSLQIFLPTRPSYTSEEAVMRNQQDASNAVHSDDWTSLRLGHGGSNQEESVQVGVSNSEHQLNPSNRAMDTLAETASFLLGSNDPKADRTRPRSDSPFSFPRQKRSVRPRLFLSIDTDSE